MDLRCTERFILHMNIKAAPESLAHNTLDNVQCLAPVESIFHYVL